MVQRSLLSTQTGRFQIYFMSTLMNAQRLASASGETSVIVISRVTDRQTRAPSSYFAVEILVVIIPVSSPKRVTRRLLAFAACKND